MVDSPASYIFSGSSAVRVAWPSIAGVFSSSIGNGGPNGLAGSPEQPDDLLPHGAPLKVEVMSAVARPRHVVVEEIFRDLAGGTPYRGTAAPPALRIRVEVAMPGLTPQEVVIDIDDAAIEVRTPHPAGAPSTTRIALGTLAAVFVLERQPRAGFLTWFGVFARQPGRVDQLVLDTPELEVARYVEYVIEQWLGLRNKPVRGEVHLP